MNYGYPSRPTIDRGCQMREGRSARYSSKKIQHLPMTKAHGLCCGHTNFGGGSRTNDISRFREDKQKIAKHL
jgi:hypothetical protein